MTAEQVAHACGPDSEHCDCVPHLRAEIARLRAQRVLDNEDLSHSFDLGLAAGERRERADVVAYLKGLADAAGQSDLFWQGVASGNGYAAQMIERGEHRREEKP